MLSILHCNSKNHVSTFNHPECLMRVDMAVEFLEKIIDESYFVPNELNNREQCARLLIRTHGSEILETFNIQTAEKIICQNCKIKHDGVICTKCYCEYYTWYFSGDVFVSNTSFDNVIKCISTIINAIDTLKNGYKYSYLLIRPPGHHCYNKGSGFCLANNAIMASRYAQSIGYKQVFILDWDYHNADGTVKLLNKNTFLCSIHAYGNMVYPGTGSTDENTINCLNIPLHVDIHDEHTRRMHDDILYLELIDMILPKIVNFKTDLVVISNGLDAHIDDTMEGMGLTNMFFVEATKKLKSLNIPLIYLLEGGYNPEVIRDVSSDIIHELKR